MRKYVIAILLLGVLCGCSGQHDPKKVYIQEEAPPVYVDMPGRTEGKEDLIFSGWVTPKGEPIEQESKGGAEAQTENRARYRDVSKLDNVLAVPSEYAGTDDVISLPLRLCGQVELCAFDLKITYDKNRLEYLGCENADEELMVHAKPDEGVVRMNYLTAQNLQEGKDMGQLQFRAMTREATRSLIHVEVVEAVSLGDDGEIIICPASVVHGTVWLNQEAGEGE